MKTLQNKQLPVTFNDNCLFSDLPHQRSISECVREKYINSYYEVNTLTDYKKLSNDADSTVTVRYKDLPNTIVAGCPYASDYDENGKLQFHFFKDEKNVHSICVGTTGSGKTTACLEPTLRAISSKKNKANFFVTDPKGELYFRNIVHLKNNGYKVYVLNFKDILASDTWNPLGDIYDIWIQQKELSEQLRPASEGDDLSQIIAQVKEVDTFDTVWFYKGEFFPSEKAATDRYNADIAMIKAKTSQLINQFISAVIPDSMLATNDPSWMMGSRDILSGLIYAILEDALDTRSGLTKEKFNLMTVNDYFERLRTETLTVDGVRALLSTKIFAHKNKDCVSYQQLRSYLNNAPTTSRSYCGIYRNSLQKWFTHEIFTVCNGTSIDIDYCSQPWAIFLITRDSEQSDYTIAGLFINWLYEKLVKKADDDPYTTPSETHFFLEETANIPPIPSFSQKIATSRSRNIHFHLYVQSYAQLSSVYNEVQHDLAQVILDNINEHTFISSQNYETKQKFSRECGKRTIQTLDSVLNPQNCKIIEVPLLTTSDLEQLPLGSMYTRRTGKPLMTTSFVPSFECEEFCERFSTPAEMGVKSVPYNSPQYVYEFLSHDQTMDEYAGKVQEKPSKKAVPIIPHFDFDF